MNAERFLERGGSRRQLGLMLNHVFIAPIPVKHFKQTLIEIGDLKPNSKANIRQSCYDSSFRTKEGTYVKCKKINFIDGRGSYVQTLDLTLEDYKLLDEVLHGAS